MVFSVDMPSPSEVLEEVSWHKSIGKDMPFTTEDLCVNGGNPLRAQLAIVHLAHSALNDLIRAFQMRRRNRTPHQKNVL